MAVSLSRGLTGVNAGRLAPPDPRVLHLYWGYDLQWGYDLTHPANPLTPLMIDFNRATGFRWDDGNIVENLLSHGVEDYEAEQVFQDRQFIILDDIDHSHTK